jgi:uncharacterized protein (TIGR00297 family)
VKLFWQSKLVLLLVLPFTGASVVLQAHWWAVNDLPVAVWALVLSLLLGLMVLKLRAATPYGSVTGATITAGLIFSTATFTPAEAMAYAPWHTALAPLLAVIVLTFLATRLDRERKAQRGMAERHEGRSAAQVAANLGVAGIVFSEFVQSRLLDSGWIRSAVQTPTILFAAGLAALAEAAADTVAAEIGTALCRRPRILTTLRPVESGTDGAVSLVGTLAGIASAAIVSAVGAGALGGGAAMFWISYAGGVFGLFFDSLLGATLEQRGWLNNDMVNFLSTAGAAAFALLLLVLLPHLGVG